MIKKLQESSIIIATILLFANQNICFSEDRSYTISEFSKGLNSQISEFLTPDNQAHDASNVRMNERYGAIAKREVLQNSFDAGASAVTGLHRYYRSNGVSRTIASLGTTLVVDDGAGNATTIDSGLTDGKRWQFVTFKDIAIGSNGYDRAQKYDGKIINTANTTGARTAGDLTADLGAPFAELAPGTTTNLTTEKWYQYKVGFYDNSTYSFSEARSNPILTGGGTLNLNLTDIPIGPQGTTARYLYRTTGQDSKAAVIANTTFFKVVNITGNINITYADAINDTVLATNTTPTWATVSASPAANCTPPLGSLITIHNERLTVAGDKTNPSDIYFSDDANPDYFNPSYYDVIRADDGDKITFIKTFLGLLTIGKTNTIQKYYTDGSVIGDWYVSDPFSFIGCPAPYSVAVSPLGILYMGRFGIYRFDGQSSNFMSDAVTPQINDISQSNIEEVAGAYVANQYRLAYTSDASGSSTNNRVLVYDSIRDAYVVDTENINCFAEFSGATDYGTLYSGSSASDGYVVAHTGSSGVLSRRYKSELTPGTFNDTRVYSTESEPVVEIAWDCNITGWLTELTGKNASITNITSIGTYLPNATIARPDTDGDWISPVYYVNAEHLNKIYWNENLGSYGDATFQIRTNTSSSMTGVNWSTAVTNPSGSDISTVNASVYIQVKSNLNTTNTTYSPTLYSSDGFVWKIAYSKVGSNYETSVLSTYQTGWKDFGVPNYKKLIKRIKVFYAGTQGNMTVNYRNDEGDINGNFTIDLSKVPPFGDEYTGASNMKIYTYRPPINSDTAPSPIGEFWQFTVTEDGNTVWKIYKVEFLYELQEITY